MELTKKEQRLYDFIKENPGCTLGEVCSGCNTAVLTVLKKTYPSLQAKLKSN
jgi:predicted transcriptional regulator